MNKDIIYIRIDEDIKQKLDMMALEEQRSLNNLVVRILTQFVEDKYSDNKKEDKESVV